MKENVILSERSTERNEMAASLLKMYSSPIRKCLKHVSKYCRIGSRRATFHCTATNLRVKCSVSALFAIVVDLICNGYVYNLYGSTITSSTITFTLIIGKHCTNYLCMYKLLVFHRRKYSSLRSSYTHVQF